MSKREKPHKFVHAYNDCKTCFGNGHVVKEHHLHNGHHDLYEEEHTNIACAECQKRRADQKIQIKLDTLSVLREIAASLKIVSKEKPLQKVRVRKPSTPPGKRK